MNIVINRTIDSFQINRPYTPAVVLSTERSARPSFILVVGSIADIITSLLLLAFSCFLLITF